MHYLQTRAWDDRAMRAYFRRERARTYHSPDQPTAPDTYRDADGRHFIVLYNCNGILAIYAVTNDDRLRHVAEEHWPPELRELYA